MTGYHFPLSMAMACISCGACFRAQPACPACTSRNIQSVEAWLSRREKKQRRDFVARVAEDMSVMTRGMK